ncbi:hypothetical protein ACFOEK_07560 [Litoribrevibacter euphylliae]|uniref:Uncharacterized protein n=1 Tax=Litoribrevibacter euphylliae TaxID=1834034 RepID=A0ABV7HDT6_9GAMM
MNQWGQSKLKLAFELVSGSVFVGCSYSEINVEINVMNQWGQSKLKQALELDSGFDFVGCSYSDPD